MYMTGGDEPGGIRTILKRPWVFLAVFLIIFFLISTFLFIIDFVPEPRTAPTDEPAPVAQAPVVIEEPVRVIVDKVGINTQVENPNSTDAATLDAELLKGAVRYPTSAKLGEAGTVYLFGHQSYLPVVKNKAFKAFNDIQKLTAGDTIRVQSATAEYEYRVTSVTLTTAADGVIPLGGSEGKLILSTCNSLGADHEERYVVEAELVLRRTLDS